MTPTRFGLPYFMDEAGRRSGYVSYLDMYGRMHLCRYRKEYDENKMIVYEVFDKEVGGIPRGPYILLRFGPDKTLGSITIDGKGTMPMAEYLTIVNEIAGSTLRRFYGTDGKEYRWGWRKVEGEEWTCTNSDVEVVADYTFKRTGDALDSPLTGGAMFTVHEDWGYMATEFLASCYIMSFIQMNNIE